MRSAPLFLLVLLASVPACAFASQYSDAAYLAAATIVGNRSFAYINFTEDNSTVYYLVVVGDEERFLVWVHPLLGVDGLGVVGEPVLEASQAEEVLGKLYRANGADLSVLSGIDGVHALVGDFSASRQPGEHKCDVYLGLDEHPCTDFLSCQKACYSRTSFCQPLALGIGRPLVNAILNYSDGKRNLSDVLLAEEEVYNLSRANNSSANIAAYISAISAIERNAQFVNANPLFSDYLICYPTNYNLSALSSARRGLLEIQRKAEPLLDLHERAEAYTQYALERWNNTLPFIVREQPQTAEAGANVSGNVSGAPFSAGSLPAAGAKGGDIADSMSVPQGGIPQLAYVAIIGAVLGIAVAVAAFGYFKGRNKAGGRKSP